MWIFLNDAMLSIVEPADTGGDPTDCLMVRARLMRDIIAVFPAAEVVSSAGTDYPFRAFIPRVAVVDAISSRIWNIGYPNFKASIPPWAQHRHDIYSRVWAVCMDLARKPKRAGTSS